MTSTSIVLAINDGIVTLAVTFNDVPVTSTLVVFAVKDGNTTLAVLFNVVPVISTIPSTRSVAVPLVQVKLASPFAYVPPSLKTI